MISFAEKGKAEGPYFFLDVRKTAMEPGIDSAIRAKFEHILNSHGWIGSPAGGAPGPYPPPPVSGIPLGQVPPPPPPPPPPASRPAASVAEICLVVAAIAALALAAYQWRQKCAEEAAEIEAEEARYRASRRRQHREERKAREEDKRRAQLEEGENCADHHRHSPADAAYIPPLGDGSAISEPASLSMVI